MYIYTYPHVQTYIMFRSKFSRYQVAHLFMFINTKHIRTALPEFITNNNHFASIVCLLSIHLIRATIRLLVVFFATFLDEISLRSKSK